MTMNELGRDINLRSSYSTNPDDHCKHRIELSCAQLSILILKESFASVGFQNCYFMFMSLIHFDHHTRLK